MSSKRSIDIAKVNRSRTSPVSAAPTSSPKPLRHHIPKKLGFWTLILRSWGLVFDAKVFQLSLLRNLLSLRGLFFALIPFAYFQLRFYFVLKPNQILSKANRLTASENTSIFLSVFALLLVMLLISFLADNLIAPALMRYNFQKIGNRKPKLYRAIKESASISLAYTTIKFIKVVVFLLVLGLSTVCVFGAYLLGSGSITQMILYLSVVTTVVVLLLSLYFAFKYWLLGGVAIGYRAGVSKFKLALKRVFGHFISSAGMGLNWLITLSVFCALSLTLSYLVIVFVDKSDSWLVQLVLLALGTTAVYFVWSIWTAWQSGYWSCIIENKALEEGLLYSRVSYSSGWQFFVLLVICTFIVLGCFVISLMYSDRLIDLLGSLSKNIPDKLQYNLPKPQ